MIGSHNVPATLNRRMLIMGGGLLIAGAAAAARQPHPIAAPTNTADLERFIPTHFGEWRFRDASGVVLPPSDALSDSLYTGLLTRTYVAAGREPVMLCIAYSNRQDGMLQVHRPEICYPAGGYALSPTQTAEVPNGLGGAIAANTFSAESVNRTEQVLYWTRIGGSFPNSWVRQRLAVMRENLVGVIPDGILVRVSTLAPDMASALPELTVFAATLVRAAAPTGRRLMVGVA